MNVEITPMQLSDLKQIQNCLTEKFDDFWTPSILEQDFQNENSYYIVAKQKNEILGFLGVSKILDELEIKNIAVRKDKRNLGIGSQLLKSMIEYAKKQSITTITLEVNEHNLSALTLYQKFGFVQVGLRKKYYHHQDDAILMSLWGRT